MLHYLYFFKFVNNISRQISSKKDYMINKMFRPRLYEVRPLCGLITQGDSTEWKSTRMYHVTVARDPFNCLHPISKELSCLFNTLLKRNGVNLKGENQVAMRIESDYYGLDLFVPFHNLSTSTGNELVNAINNHYTRYNPIIIKGDIKVTTYIRPGPSI